VCNCCPGAITGTSDPPSTRKNQKKSNATGKVILPRRRFLGAAAALAVVPRHVLGGEGKKPPSEKLSIAGVGLGAMGAGNLKACDSENIAALCDVDWQLASVTFQRYPKAARYKDYRRMLEK
jgi:hypothetical protein